MVLELETLTYEDPPVLKQRREKGNMIIIYKLINKVKVINNNELLLREIGDSKQTREHSMKLGKDDA